MKLYVNVALAGVLASCLMFQSGNLALAEDKPAEETSKTGYKVKLKLLKPEQLEALLNKRFEGKLGSKVDQFANMFVVISSIELGMPVALSAADADTGNITLEAAFPESYKPTFKEFLDAFALQTNTKWTYDEKYQYVKSDKPRDEADGMIVIMFEHSDNKIPYEMTPASDWTAYTRTNWIQYAPKIAPVGMDMHVLGRLSGANKADEQTLLQNAPQIAALDMLKRAKGDATTSDITKGKVGDYTSYSFEIWLPPGGEKKIHWRQWYFMVDNQLCYVISTLMKDQDATLFPDVENMIGTFRKVKE